MAKATKAPDDVPGYAESLADAAPPTDLSKFEDAEELATGLEEPSDLGEWFQWAEGAHLEGVLRRPFFVTGGEFSRSKGPRPAYEVLEPDGRVTLVSERAQIRQVRDFPVGSYVTLDVLEKDSIGGNKTRWRLKMDVRKPKVAKGQRPPPLIKAVLMREWARLEETPF